MSTFAASAKHTASQVQNKTVTTNGMTALRSTLNANLDLFSKSGEIVQPNFVSLFAQALKEDQDTALRNLLHARDVRGGKGVRNTVQNALVWLAINEPNLLLNTNLIEKIPYVGYWKDLSTLVENSNVPLEVKKKVIRVIAEALEKNETKALAAKWVKLKSPVGYMLRGYLKLSERDLRKKLVELRKEVVERKMCEKDWTGIIYSHVPSKAMNKYKEAFKRNDSVRFDSFINRVATGEEKINASTLFPHEVSKVYQTYTQVDRYNRYDTSVVLDKVAEAQWNALPNYLAGNNTKILPVVDLSGSMNSSAGNGYSYAHIAVTLTAYIATRSEGAFKNLLTTIADKPVFVDLTNQETLLGQIKTINEGRVGYTTNIQATFDLILNHALSNNVPQEDMPEMVLILSDCQGNYSGRDETAYQMARRKFEQAGYQPPQLVFWVLNANTGNVPVKFNDSGSALVNGFSPATLKGVLSDLESYTPLNVMKTTLEDSRYTITYY